MPYPFWGEGSPTKIDYRKRGTLILTSLLEDTNRNPAIFSGFSLFDTVDGLDLGNESQHRVGPFLKIPVSHIWGPSEMRLAKHERLQTHDLGLRWGAPILGNTHIYV